MGRDVFSANVKPGGLVSQDEIMILICYMLSSIKTGLSKEDIISAIESNKIANYFEITDAITSLTQHNNILFSESECLYYISDTGKIIAEQLDVSLPYSIREQAINSAINLLKQHRREAENKVEIKKFDKGYYVICSIPSGEFDLMNISIYVPDLIQARKVKQNFQREPDFIYQTLLATFTDDKDLVKEALKKISD